jgi:protein-tyrosine phosphatase
MDDGSGSVEESIALLEMLSEQGAEKAVATPHFFANDESIDRFLERREKSLAELNSAKGNLSIEILAGAEVKYYQGISRMEDIQKLTIGNTKLLLLEMSFSKWTEYTVKELVELSSRSDIKVVLAHIERYMKFQPSTVWERLYDSGMLMQVNASFFCEFLTKSKALKMLADGKIHLIGSDCHNVRSRPPKLRDAYDVIEKKLGSEFLQEMDDYGNSVLS